MEWLEARGRRADAVLAATSSGMFPAERPGVEDRQLEARIFPHAINCLISIICMHGHGLEGLARRLGFYIEDTLLAASLAPFKLYDIVNNGIFSQRVGAAIARSVGRRSAMTLKPGDRPVSRYFGLIHARARHRPCFPLDPHVKFRVRKKPFIFRIDGNEDLQRKIGNRKA